MTEGARLLLQGAGHERRNTKYEITTREKVMEDSKQFRSVVEGVVDSYESKVKTVISLMREVNQRIKSYHIEQEELVDRLRNILAKNECLRKKDFDTMMDGIRSHQEAREQETSRMVDDFCGEEEENVARLKEILATEKSSVIKDFEVLKEKMLNRPKERERRIGRILKDFHRDQEELNTALRMLLERGPSVRIKDLRAMVKAFHFDRTEENTRIDNMLEEFERVKDEISNQWQGVMATVGN